MTFQTLGSAANAVLRGLTEGQKKTRKLVVGGSDAGTIMSGDEDRIMRLYLEKRGEAKPEDLSDVLQVQLGSFTEPFNVEWFEKQTGRHVTSRGDWRLSLDYPWMGANLDGMTDDETTVVECKHVSAFAKPEEIRARYFAQVTHYMIVCGVTKSVLSVLYGNHKWEAYEIAYDPLYAEQLIDAERHFWECVKSGTPPVAVTVATPVEAIRRVDMSGSNSWGENADKWLKTRGYAQTFDKAAKELKSLIEPDVAEAFGHGIRATKAKNGAITIREI